MLVNTKRVVVVKNDYVYKVRSVKTEIIDSYIIVSYTKYLSCRMFKKMLTPRKSVKP